MHTLYNPYFKEYYQNTIESSLVSGFKLVLGGTGLGKTTAIADVIKDPANANRKFIYIANRTQLLTGLISDIKNKSLFRVQKNDADIVREVSEFEFRNFLDDKKVLSYIDYLIKKNRLKYGKNDVISVFNSLHHSKFEEVSEDYKEFLRERASIFMNFFKNILSTAYLVQNHKVKEENLYAYDYDQFIKHPFIIKLFPYIEFKRDENVRILLITLQKAFFGFFDGYKNVNLFKLENEINGELEFDLTKRNGEYIIFLDEFDFLESDLIDLVSKDMIIKNPFDFVQYFYDAMKKKKLPYRKFLYSHKKYRNQLKKITENIDSLRKNYGIKYPRINQFVCNDEKLKKASIFQSRYTVSTHPIYLNQKRRTNAFTLQSDGNKANSFALFNTINQSTAEIIRIFKELEFKEPEIYNSLLSHCYSNSDVFKEAIRTVKQYPLRKIKEDTNYDKFHSNGFGLYEIQDMNHKTDEEEVNLNYYAIYTTPEKILQDLVENNLVFGLSATSKLPRVLKSFDTFWLRKALKDKYLKITSLDKRLIAKAYEEKQLKRNNNLTVVEAIQTNLNIDVKDLIDVCSRTDSNFGTGRTREFRSKRVRHFFAALEWIIDCKDNHFNKESHILFFNSFSIIKHFFNKIPQNHSIIRVERRSQIKDKIFEYYELFYRNIGFNVIFYDSRKANKIHHEEKEKEGYYQLFLEGKPVLLVTTYPSTGNGVNLQYKTSDGEKTDFLNIHLLESPYFVFGKKEEDGSDQDVYSLIKKNIYYIAKLEKAKIISYNEFFRYLHFIRSLNILNESYWKTDDGILNRIAIFIQAIGRIERTWNNMKDQTIRLDTDVIKIFQRFCLGPEFSRIIQENTPFLSNNIKKVFNGIEKDFNCKIEKAKIHLEDIQESELKSKTEVSIMLADHKCLRAGLFDNNPEKITQIKKEWEEIRVLGLKHSFYPFESIEKCTTNLLIKKGFIFNSSNYDYLEECFYINEKKEIIPKEFAVDGYNPWFVNSIYNRIKGHQVIRGYFDLKGYELGFDFREYFFTPYFYQSILVGAIGEESIKAIIENESKSENNHLILENASSDSFPNSLFELADFKLSKCPIYIDCKNYSDVTIMHYGLEEDDPFYRPKLNEPYLRNTLYEKFSTLNDYHHDKNLKYILIRLFGNKDQLIETYFDENLKSVGRDFKKAKIIIIPCAIEKSNDEKYITSNELKMLIDNLKKFYL